eukprot:scaffold34825_cov27-Tisochrysis_lutea.AAC.1
MEQVAQWQLVGRRAQRVSRCPCRARGLGHTRADLLLRHAHECHPPRALAGSIACAHAISHTQATSHASQLVVELTKRASALESLLDAATASAVEATAVTSCVSAGVIAPSCCNVHVRSCLEPSIFVLTMS